MGFAKYLEDIIKKSDERKNELEVNDWSENGKIYYVCSYCDESFETSENRNNHIKFKHNAVGPLFFVNGKIIPGEFYIDTIISANIVMCGIDNIEISIDKKKIESNDDNINILPYLNMGESSYIVNIGQNIFKIYKYDSKNINISFLDSIIEKWEKQIYNNDPLDPLPGSYYNSLNEAEICYINGFFNYYTACKTDINSTDKKKRYEEAFAILYSFSKLTPKARILLKVIAFRLNWIEKLRNLSKETKGTFDTVVDFFYKSESSLTKKGDKQQVEQLIYVESDIEVCIKAIISYQKGEWNDVDEFLVNWTDLNISQIDDVNKKDRILLLKARRMEAENDEGSAKMYYDRILTPFFKKRVETP
jgi:hypothetical protein